MNEYAGLSDIRKYFDFADANDGSAANVKLKEYLLQASREIDRYTHRRFYPYHKFLWFDSPDDRRTLQFQDDVLELNGLSDNGGASAVSLGVVFLRSGDSFNLTPYDNIELDDSTGSTLDYSGTPQKAVKADVIIGFRELFDEDNYGWIDSGASLTDDLASGTTLASTTGSGGTNSLGESPRFATMQLWRLGSGASQEMAYVLDTTLGDMGSGITQIIRGVNGTTATCHANGAPIYTWQPEEVIKRQTIRLAKWAYEARNNAQGGRTLFPQFGSIELPDTWPKDVSNALDRFVKWDMGSVK